MNDEITNDEYNEDEEVSVSLVGILEDISSVLDEARSLPLSANIVVNKARLKELLNMAIQVLPDNIITADRVVAEAETVIDKANNQSEEIINRAKSQAEDIIARAHEQAKSLVSSERIIMLANENADKIIEKAEENSHKLAQGADQYCDDRLYEIEELLEAISRQVTAGREAILTRRGFDPEVQNIDGAQLAEENYPYDDK